MIIYNQEIYPFSFNEDDTNIRATEDVFFIREGKKYKQFFKGQYIPASIWGAIFGIVEEQVSLPPEDISEQPPDKVSEISEVDPIIEKLPEDVAELSQEKVSQSLVEEIPPVVPLGIPEVAKVAPKKRKIRRKSLIKKP